MKLGLVLFACLVVLVSQSQAAVNPNTMLSMIRAQAAVLKNSALTPEQRQAHERLLYHYFTFMSERQLRSALPPALYTKLIARLRYLKEQQNKQKQLQAQKGTTRTPSGTNMVMSRASPVRTAGASTKTANSLTGNSRNLARGNIRTNTRGVSRNSAIGNSQTSTKGPAGKKGSSGPSSSTAAQRLQLRRRLMAAMMRKIRAYMRRRPNSPMEALHKYKSYQSQANRALHSGCNFPMSMESSMEGFMFGAGGCRMGGMACYMNGQSCVDVGMSMMCCPPGYSSGTISVMHRMNQMQNLMSQLS
nr:hypothetical protein [Crepidula fornicata]